MFKRLRVKVEGSALETRICQDMASLSTAVEEMMMTWLFTEVRLMMGPSTGTMVVTSLCTEAATQPLPASPAMGRGAEAASLAMVTVRGAET